MALVRVPLRLHIRGRALPSLISVVWVPLARRRSLRHAVFGGLVVVHPWRPSFRAVVVKWISRQCARQVGPARGVFVPPLAAMQGPARYYGSPARGRMSRNAWLRRGVGCSGLVPRDAFRVVIVVVAHQRCAVLSCGLACSAVWLESCVSIVGCVAGALVFAVVRAFATSVRVIGAVSGRRWF